MRALYLRKRMRLIFIIIGTAGIVMRAGCVKETELRPSVCLFHPAAVRRCGGFAAVGPVGRRYRSTAARSAGECGQCHVVS